MNDSKVATIPNCVNDASVDEVIAWAQKMADRGTLDAKTVQLKTNALRQLVSVLDADEHMDLTTIVNNVDHLGKRWAIKNSANPETTRTYIGRARTLLNSFFDYQRDPMGFEPQGKKGAAAAASGESARPKRKRKAPSTPEAQPQSSPSSSFRFPLGDGRVFRFDLPAEGINSRDAKRIAYHLMTLANDFDPDIMPPSRRIDD